jgi:HlyD family secretion protein
MMHLIRKQVLDKVTDPDRLDETLRIVRPWSVYALGLVALVTLAGITWSIVATAPEKVGGDGVLLSSAGIAVVTAPDTGWVERILVAPGDSVETGATVAEISRPDLLDRLRSAEAEAELTQRHYDNLQQSLAEQQRLADAQQKRLADAYREQLTRLEAQYAAKVKLIEGKRRLRDKGVIAADTALDDQAQVAQLENEISGVRNRLTELEVERERMRGEQRRELDAALMDVRRLTDQTEAIRREYERKRVAVSPAAGVVVEVSVSNGDPLIAGQAIIRLLSTAGEQAPPLTALVYLPAEGGKRVRPGMAAQVVPSVVKRELDGYLRARVIRVADLPSSRASLANRLRNDVLVDKILGAGPPLEVELELEPDPDAPSGYAWSSGRGPDLSIQPGTLTRTQVVVGRTHLISLAFPAFDYVFGWAKETRQ